MTAHSDVCGAVDLDEHGVGSGAVCTSTPHPGSTHIDTSVPECVIQWGPAPGLRHEDESALCCARASHREGDAWPETPCNKRVYVGGWCAKHAQMLGLVG